VAEQVQYEKLMLVAYIRKHWRYFACCRDSKTSPCSRQRGLGHNKSIKNSEHIRLLPFSYNVTDRTWQVNANLTFTGMMFPICNVLS